MYFLVLTLMECIPAISDSGGVPVLALPLTFVLGVSMVKDIYEDYFRHKTDAEENNRKCMVAKETRWAEKDEIRDTPNVEEDDVAFLPQSWSSIQAG